MNKGKYRILLAEDEPSLYRLISFKLEKEGFSVDTVTNGAIAFDKVVTGEYDALILDLMLPVLDGMQVLKKLRKNNKTLPVLILSAKSQERDILNGLESGANDYLTKPFRPAELIVRLKKLLVENND